MNYTNESHGDEPEHELNQWELRELYNEANADNWKYEE
jgi:hypothetical protein